jgi:hypothetical protein
VQVNTLSSEKAVQDYRAPRSPPIASIDPTSCLISAFQIQKSVDFYDIKVL